MPFLLLLGTRRATPNGGWRFLDQLHRRSWFQERLHAKVVRPPDPALAEVPEVEPSLAPTENGLVPARSSSFGLRDASSASQELNTSILEAREENPPDYDISTALLPGQLWVDASELPVVSSAHARTGRERRLDIPLRWITHAVRESEEGTVLLPVPQWE